MDFSKLKTTDWLKVGGAIGMVIFGFFGWAKVDFGVLGKSQSFGNAFDFEVRGLISWILVVGIGVVTLLQTQGRQIGKIQWPIISVLATGLATVLMLLLIIAPGDLLSPALGMWLSFISTIVSFVGSVMAFTSGGGKLKDLTDVNKLKSSFGQG